MTRKEHPPFCVHCNKGNQDWDEYWIICPTCQSNCELVERAEILFLLDNCYFDEFDDEYEWKRLKELREKYSF